MRPEDVILTKRQIAGIYLLIVRDVFKGILNKMLQNWFMSLSAILGFVITWFTAFNNDGTPMLWYERLGMSALFAVMSMVASMFIELFAGAIFSSLRETYGDQFNVYVAEEKERTLRDGVDKVILDE